LKRIILWGTLGIRVALFHALMIMSLLSEVILWSKIVDTIRDPGRMLLFLRKEEYVVD